MTSEEQLSATAKLPTLADVARHCNVSIATASRAFRNADRIAPETRERILAAAAEIGYDAEVYAPARKMRLGSQGRHLASYAIALIISPAITTVNYYALLFRGVAQEIEEHGYTLIIKMSTGDLAALPVEERLPPILARGDVDGFLIATGDFGLYEAIMRHPLLKQRPRMLLLGRYIDPTSGRIMPGIKADEQHGAYLAVRHLLELGHRHLVRICHPYYELNWNLQNRYLGIVMALTEYGLNPETHLHTYVDNGELIVSPELRSPCYPPPRLDEEGLKTHPFLGFLHEHPQITGVLATNDANAIQSWRVLTRAGYRVPEEISIVGFDDADPLLNDAQDNILTTVRIPLVEIGRESVRQLIHQINDPQQEINDTVFSTELIIRGTTGPARQA